MPSRSNKPEDAPDTILDLLQRVGDEATRLTKGRLQKTELSAEELALQYGLKPTTIENLKHSQAEYKKMGRDLTLEQVYFLEFDQPDRGEEEGK
jgi:hypothetical protein